MFSRVCPNRCLPALLGLALLLTASPVPAQEAPVQEAQLGNQQDARAADEALPDDRDWYDVEVVIFRQSDSGNVRSSERWPVAPGPALFERYARVDDQLPASSDEHFQLREDAAKGLLDTVRQLRNSSTYQVLSHTLWRQPGMPGATAPAVYFPLDQAAPNQADTPDASDMATALEAGQGGLYGPDRALPPGLSGHVRLVRERFLHFEVDLRYREAGRSSEIPMRGGQPVEGNPGSGNPMLAADPEPVVVMREQRRMRSGELHYLDNPRLGVLVIATPVKKD